MPLIKMSQQSCKSDSLIVSILNWMQYLHYLFYWVFNISCTYPCCSYTLYMLSIAKCSTIFLKFYTILYYYTLIFSYIIILLLFLMLLNTFFSNFRGSVWQVLGSRHRLWSLHIDLFVHRSRWAQSYWVCMDSKSVKNIRWQIQNKTVWFSHVIWDQNIKLSNRSSGRMLLTFLFIHAHLCFRLCNKISLT